MANRVFADSEEDAYGGDKMAGASGNDNPLGSMGRNVLIIGAIVVAAVLINKYHPRTTLAADGLGQRWDATVEESRAAHMPVVVVFTADWCPACGQLHRDVLSRNDIQSEISRHYLKATVDMTQQSPAAAARSQRYGVSAIPTLIRFDADGKETDRTHYLPPDRMLAWLREGYASAQ